MSRIFCGLPIFQVAIHAFRSQARKNIVHVTCCTGHGSMLSRQRKFAEIVIERCTLPLRRGVTRFALLREICLTMVWTYRLIVVFQMTITARAGRTLKYAARMTLSTSDGNVFTGQAETGQRVVVKLRTLPCRAGMAGRTIAWKASRDVIWIGRVRKVRGVATKTICRCSLEFSAHVTARTSQCLMRAG